MRIMKRIMALLIVIAFLGASILPNVSDVRAASIDNATNIVIGQTVNGEISKNDKEQYYKFTINESGAVNIKGQAFLKKLYLRLYNSNYECINTNEPTWNSTSEVIPMNYTYYLNYGTYYFALSNYYEYYDEYFGKYSFSVSFTSTEESYKEDAYGNNYIFDGYDLNLDGSKYIGQLSLNDDKDFYKLTLNESGRINICATVYFKRVRWKLYDEDGNEMFNDELKWNETTNQIVIDDIKYLNKGVYYLVLENVDWDKWVGEYQLSVTFDSAKESFVETEKTGNNSIKTSSAIVYGTNYGGVLAYNDEKDFYKFESFGKLVMNFKGEISNVTVKIYNSDGEQCGDTLNWSKDDTTGLIDKTVIVSLGGGIYYLVIEKTEYKKYSGFYEFSLNSLNQDNCPHNEYTSKVHEPTYFAKGYTKYTCKDCGHSYKDKYTAMKVLSQAEIRSDYNSVGKGKLTVGWYTDSDADGYEIKYSLKSSMKNSKTAKVSDSDTNVKTIKKLKRKKKYYVQVRKYKTSGEKTVYSPWSVKYWFKVS